MTLSRMNFDLREPCWARARFWCWVSSLHDARPGGPKTCRDTPRNWPSCSGMGTTRQGHVRPLRTGQSALLRCVRCTGQVQQWPSPRGPLSAARGHAAASRATHASKTKEPPDKANAS